jgi:beta-carotene ketolase (CrtW type)
MGMTTIDDTGAGRAREGATSLALAIAVIGGWLALHVFAIFFYPWTGIWPWLVPVVVLAITWLYVGMFIVAHDCMHGTVAPGRPWLNVWIGRVALFCYAGFSFERMRKAHFAHHHAPGTHDDPDFDYRKPPTFWPWYLKFFVEYFGFREFAIMFTATGLYLYHGAPYENLLWFWGLPSMLSSLQLFIFGTYLPHRPGAGLMPDRHHARSNDYPWLVSLLTCFHFGYHHEHHSNPSVPWWRLPELRSARHGARSAPA